MAPRKSVKNNIVAKLVTGKTAPCAFCKRQVDDELLYGKLYAIGDIQCHYFCVLLSSCLMQKGKDEHGLFGFLYEDILIEVERCKKHKCSYCNQMGANLGCSISQCRKQFHLPCGKEKNSVSLFYGNYKSFCQIHAPRQTIPESIQIKAKARKARDNKVKRMQQQDCNFKDLKELSLVNSCESDAEAQSVCVICYEQVDGYPTNNTFWPPCCARDAWFHRTCLQRMALSAGMHYLKCPLCNDKENFYEAVISQGYYVPDRDAAWELEQNAFAEIYERPIDCSAPDCACPMGRSHDADTGAWSISLCVLCGSSGEHAACAPAPAALHVCAVCRPHAPQDLDYLASTIEAVISQEQAQSTSRVRRGPVMPSRMSLRRTKRHVNGQTPSCSTTHITAVNPEIESQTSTLNISTGRETLNLKQPRKRSRDNTSTTKSPIQLQFPPNKAEVDHRSPLKSSKYDSPTKILEEGLKNKFGLSEVIIKEDMVDELRKRFKKPQPLSVKRKIVNDILNGLFDNLLLDTKQKEPIKQWCSPKKLTDEDDVIMLEEPLETIDLTTKDDQPITDTPTTSALANQQPTTTTPIKTKTIDIEKDSSLEISAKDEIINIDVIKMDNTQKEFLNSIEDKYSKKSAFKFSPCNKEEIHKKNIDLDVETFKNQYLNEVSCSKIEEKTVKMPQRKRKTDKEKIVFQYESKKRKLKRKSISIKNKNIQVKIKWRKEQLKLQFNDIMAKKNKKYRQYVLKYSPEKPSNADKPETSKSSSMISKPDVEVTPMKRKYIKQEKSPDNLVQTSIDKFFKLKSPDFEK